MARYIKANPKVAAFLGLERDRNTVTDGNYLLWQGDMLAFGPLTQLAAILEQIGAIALLPHEARQEQDGTVVRPLPTATDERFVVEIAPAEETPAEAPEVAAEATESEQAGETTGEDENPAETPENEPTDDEPENE